MCRVELWLSLKAKDRCGLKLRRHSKNIRVNSFVLVVLVIRLKDNSL